MSRTVSEEKGDITDIENSWGGGSVPACRPPRALRTAMENQ
jgi:hypothetical protein